MSHPELKTLIKFYNHDCSRSESAGIEKHIADCALCRDRLAHFDRHFVMSDNSSVKPRRDVLSAILQQYKQKPAVVKMSFRRFAAPAAAIVILVPLVYFFFGTSAVPGIKITVLNQSGSVLADTVQLKPGDRLNQGASVFTADNSGAELVFDNTFSIRMSAGCELKILESRIDDNKKGYVFSFDLVRGSIAAKFNHGKFPMRYCFTAGDFTLNSIGTEFLLSTGERSLLVMKEGELNLVDKGDSVVKAVAGYKYFSNSALKADAIESADMSVFEEFVKGDYNKDFSLRLKINNVKNAASDVKSGAITNPKPIDAEKIKKEKSESIEVPRPDYQELRDERNNLRESIK